MTKRRPKFVPDRVYVMTDCQGSVCITVGITEFIVRLQNEFRRIERHRAVRMKTQVGNRLVGEKNRRGLQFQETIETKGPVQLAE